jgi:ribosomal protein L15
MVVRRRKKYRKKLGSRSYHGDTKNRRGAGIRGGKGRAGAWDHKKSTFRYEVLGKKGFVPPRKWSAYAFATPAAIVPTPAVDTSFTLIVAVGLICFKSNISWAKSSIE